MLFLITNAPVAVRSFRGSNDLLKLAPEERLPEKISRERLNVGFVDGHVEIPVTGEVRFSRV